MSISGKVALITGAGRGIGAATAYEFAKAGAKLVLIARSSSQLDMTRVRIVSEFPEAEVVCIPTDLKKPAEIEKVFDGIRQEFARLDILVNNAGSIVVKEFEALSIDEWDQTFQVNLRALFFLCQGALPFLKRTQGCIVNVSSLAGLQETEKFPGFSAYTAAKMGVVGLTQVLAVELKSAGVRVSFVAPGAVNTRMLKEALPNVKTSVEPEQIAAEILRGVR